MKAVYTAHGSATGGRDGQGRTDDGKVDVKLTLPKEMGGSGTGTNPEQLFSVGYSACYLGALKFVAGKERSRSPTTPRCRPMSALASATTSRVSVSPWRSM